MLIPLTQKLSGRRVGARLIGIGLVLGIVIGLSGEIGLFISFGLLMILAGLLIFNFPVLLLCIIPFISASVSLLREVTVPLGGTQISLSGFLWIAIAGIVVLYLLVHVNKVRIPRYLWPFILFSLWAVIRWLITPTGFIGLKDVLWYSMPVLFGLFVPLALKRGYVHIATNVRRIENAFMYSAIIPVVVYAIALSTGVAEMTWRGPRGELVGAARGTPLYLLIVLSLALANWRYGPVKSKGKFFSLLSLGTIFFTLGRMASMLGLTLAALHRVNPRKKWQILGSALLAGVLALYAVTHVPLLKERFFFTEDWDISEGLTGVNTAGRNLIWPVVVASAMREPIIGHGLGVARLVTAQLFMGKKDVTEYHPHNEYLQIFHDTGIVGLMLFLFGWVGILRRVWQRWEQQWKGRAPAGKWAMASSLGIGVVLISSLTDNTIHYPAVIVLAFIIFAIEEVFSHDERNYPV